MRPEPDRWRCRTVDISDVRDAKRRALAAHVSQMTDLIDDDPTGFRLSPEFIERATGPVERYFEPKP